MRGMFRSFMSQKINIHRSLTQGGESGVVSSSRLPSLSMTETKLASRGVTAPWTRFQRVCLQHGREARPVPGETTVGKYTIIPKSVVVDAGFGH